MVESARQIPLEVWQNPQGDVILKVSERECHVYFGCWDEESNPADYIAKLTFQNCSAAKYTHDEHLPYKIVGQRYHSCILIVEHSRWLNERMARKQKFYSNSLPSHDYKHFVVHGHEVIVEVIAKDFTLERISKEQAGEFARLIDEG
ncbi:hypothetical protein [Paenibacillus kobensis]|uniref:hypothetical protein n=1 Tax=Paenibacillus kobensis TaxID=59841 RepID=UPI000FDB6BF3|nr:hypothetical protein [Paenibacillus kobensis]